jgi:homopolymeric O-antigen transport system permease protein
MLDRIALTIVVGSGAASVYDSDRRSPLLLTELANFWSYRALIRLLVLRDVLARYKRSMLGIWWTLLNPLLTMTVMWLIFSHLFRFTTAAGGVPYVVYLLSGLIFVIFFQQGVETVASSVVVNADILRKVYVPAEVFCLSGALAAAVNLLLSMIPLLILQLALGVGIPWTLVLVPLPILALLFLVVGLGLIVAAIAVRFHDMLDFNRVILTMVYYLTPVFYPISIVPPTIRRLLELNPVYHDLNLFRSLVYIGSLSSWQTWVAAFGSGLIALAAGLWIFGKSWRTAAALI